MRLPARPRPQRARRAALARRPERILALDGGGVRGALSAVLLERLEAASPGFLGATSLFAGTSTGGILALGLAAGWTPAHLRSLYASAATEVFADGLLDDLHDVGKLFGADYDWRHLQRWLRRVFGRATLGDLPRRVAIPSFDLDNEARDPHRREWKAKIFHNCPGIDSDAHELIVDVALASCAAPTYFPAYRGYVDGGVVAGNPSMVGLAQALDRRVPGAARAALGRIRLLSLGTGRPLRFVPGQRLDWGYVQWARPLLRLLLDGSSGLADFQCRQLLGRRYHRLAPVFPPGVRIEMDAVRAIPDLVRRGRRVDLRSTTRWLLRVRWQAGSSGNVPRLLPRASWRHDSVTR